MDPELKRRIDMWLTANPDLQVQWAQDADFRQTVLDHPEEYLGTFETPLTSSEARPILANEGTDSNSIGIQPFEDWYANLTPDMKMKYDQYNMPSQTPEPSDDWYTNLTPGEKMQYALHGMPSQTPEVAPTNTTPRVWQDQMVQEQFAKEQAARNMAAQGTQPSIIGGVPNAQLPFKQSENFVNGLNLNAVNIDPIPTQQAGSTHVTAEPTTEPTVTPAVTPTVTPEATVAKEPEQVPVNKTPTRVYPVSVPSSIAGNSDYSLDNINKLDPKAQAKAAKQAEQNNKKAAKEASERMRKAQAEVLEEKTVPEPEQKPKGNKRLWKAVGDTMINAANKSTGTLGNALASGLSEGTVSMDPSGVSATLRQQADDQLKEAAEMDMLKQQQIQDANISPEQRAEKYAAVSAAAKHAQQAAQAKPGEYVDTVVESPDIATQQQMQQQYRGAARELSKDSAQYIAAARQRAMDAQKADYDYNENRRINNRIYQLTGGMGIKDDNGKYQVVGGTRDNENKTVPTPEQTPTTPTPTTPTQPAEQQPVTQPVTQPTAQQPTTQNQPKALTPAEQYQKAQEDAAARNKPAPVQPNKTATSTPTASATPNTAAPANSASNVSTNYSTNSQTGAVPAYVSGLHRWYTAASQIYSAGGKVDNLGAKQSADVAQRLNSAVDVCNRTRKPTDPQFNLNDFSYDNCMKVYDYIRGWLPRAKGGK